VHYYELLCTMNKKICTKKCLKQVLRAFEKGLAGKKMPAGTRLGTAVLEYQQGSGFGSESRITDFELKIGSD
jgi:hypothetical protein